jgi:hypothetical protein
MHEAMLIARASLTLLVLLVLAAPVQAWSPPDPSAGGTLAAPEAGGTAPVAPAAGGPAQLVPQSPSLDDLLDLLPGLVPGGEPVPVPEPLLPATTTIVPGRVARLRTDGRAAIPRGAPKRVRRLIAQYNRIVGRRYRWGGGHAVVDDTAFDCSGAVGYGLIKTGMLQTTMVSGSFSKWGAAGPGRWVTTYSTRGHVYTEVAGLRLDTSPVGDPLGQDGVRWRPLIGARRSFHMRHPIGL